YIAQCYAHETAKSSNTCTFRRGSNVLVLIDLVFLLSVHCDCRYGQCRSLCDVFNEDVGEHIWPSQFDRSWLHGSHDRRVESRDQLSCRRWGVTISSRRDG